jgi:hypothetical protein
MTGTPLVWTLIASMAVFDLVGLFYLWRRRQTEEAHSWQGRNGLDWGTSRAPLDRRQSERRTSRQASAAQQRFPSQRIRNKKGI